NELEFAPEPARPRDVIEIARLLGIAEQFVPEMHAIDEWNVREAERFGDGKPGAGNRMNHGDVVFEEELAQIGGGVADENAAPAIRQSFLAAQFRARADDDRLEALPEMVLGHVVEE